MSGKIFEYLALRRAIFALAPPSCPVGTVLRQSGVRHWIVSPDDIAGIGKALEEMRAAWLRGELNGAQSTSDLSDYNRKEQAKRLAAILDELAS